jgi:hypothetical protein
LRLAKDPRIRSGTMLEYIFNYNEFIGGQNVRLLAITLNLGEFHNTFGNQNPLYQVAGGCYQPQAP